MKNLILLFWVLLSSQNGMAFPLTPSQLNIAGFSNCLAKIEKPFELDRLKEAYHFNAFDLLLPYLAVYSGSHLPSVLTPLQRQSEKYWQGAWENQGEALARDFERFHPTNPGQALALAAKHCEAGDVFCAALTLQNVLKTFGRHAEGGEFNPAWYTSHENEWNTSIPQIQTAMISLRSDGGGDRFGEWYHFFGILSYASRELALGKTENTLSFTVHMNQLLNRWIGGAPENPLKAQSDRESAQISWEYLNGTLPSPPESLDCNREDAYVNSLR